MNILLILIFIGFGLGIVIFPIFLGIYLFLKNVFLKMKIKKMLKQNKFLIPIDERDYDFKAWQNKKFGNIDPELYKKDLENFNLKIFKKNITLENNKIEDIENE